MATYSSHRLIMGKVENCNFFLSQWRYLEFFLQKCLLSSPLRFILLLSRVGKILTTRDFPCGKSGDFPGWEIPSKFGKLGNTGKYFIKSIYYIFFFCKKNVFKLYSFYYETVPFKVCYKMNCIGTLYKMKMKAASL